MTDTTITNGGIITSFSNTPQAQSDLYTYAALTEDATAVFYLDVMANDLGGKAKTLWSLDNGDSLSTGTKIYAPLDLLTQDTGGISDATPDTSLNGAKIWIENGKVAYQATATSNAYFQSLSAGEVGTDTFTYAIRLSNGALSWSTVTVEIKGTNDAPVITAQDLVGGVTEQTGTPTGNLSDTGTITFSDVDSTDVHLVSATGTPVGTTLGSLVAVKDSDTTGSGTGGQLHWTYTVADSAIEYLAAGQTKVESFTITLNDQHGGLITKQIDVTITGTNDGPVAVADVAGGTENQTLTIDVLANDTDVDDGHVFTLNTASAPTDKGTASVVAGKVEFNPGSDFDHLAKDVVEHVTLSYQMQDQYGVTSTSTVDVTVTGTNDGPVAVADVAGGTENQTLTIDVLANDTDLDDAHSFTLVSASAPGGQGSASVVDGKVVFNPGTDFDHLAKDVTATVTLSYSMQDENGAPSSSTVTVTVTGTNDGPVAVADVAGGTENQTLTIDVLANDTDLDDAHSFTLVSASAPGGQGSASVVDGKVEFNPGTDFDHLAKDVTATVTLNYSMQDENGAPSSSTVTVTVTGTNDAPVAVADVAAGTENQTLAIDVLANDTDLDDAHSFTLVSASAPGGQGSASVVDGKVVFNPGTDFDHLAKDVTATVTLSYSMQDENGAPSSSTVTVTVTGTNDAPVAVADVAAGTENQTLAIDVLANDTDLDDAHSFTLVSASAPGGQGSASVVDGKVVFNPGTAFDHLAQGATEHVTLSYQMQDQYGVTSTSTVDVTITGTNDIASISGSHTGSVLEAAGASAGSPTTSGTLSVSDADDGQATLYTATDLTGNYGSFTFNAISGAWTYALDNTLAATQTLNTGDVRHDSLTVVSLDGTASQAIDVTINGATDSSQPVITSSGTLFSINEHLLDSTTSPGAFLSSPSVAVIASDSDGNPLTYSLLSDSSGGAFQISSTGLVSVKDLALLDYESAFDIPGGAKGYALDIQVSDGITAAVTKTLYVQVNDVTTGSGTGGNNIIDGGNSGESITGQGGSDFIFGDGGNDVILGDGGSSGQPRADNLYGGAGDDTLTGGKGDDVLSGGVGADTFVWSLADTQSSSGLVTPYTDTIKDWDSNDKLDLHDLLVGEHANALSLDAYLDFSFSASTGNTTIAIKSAGSGAADQFITLEHVQLAGANDQAIITNLLNANKLVVDL